MALSENIYRMFIDYYKLLNISYTASDDEIKLAYHNKLDVSGSNNQNLTDNLIYTEIENAYQTLINPAKRFKYNLQLIKRYQKKKSNGFKIIIKRLFHHDKD